MSDADQRSIQGRLDAIGLCIQDGRLDDAENGLLDVLGEVRKRQAEREVGG